MKKVKLFVTMAVIVFSIMLCWAMNAFALTEDGWEFLLLDNEVTITKYVGESKDIVVPQTLAGCPVTKMNGEILPKNIVSLKIEAQLKELPYAFANFREDLETVVLPEGLEKIGKQAFQWCGKLQRINIPSTVKVIGGHAFPNCYSLEKIEFPEGIEEIGDGCFGGSGLTEIDLTNIKRFSGSYHFSGCKNLKSAKLSKHAANVPWHIFDDCPALENVEFTTATEEIETGAFLGCGALKQVILPTSLKVIRDGAFNRTGLAEVIIPYGTERMEGAFQGCTDLYSVFIPETVTTMYGHPSDGSPNAIIYCSQDSYAAEYCKKNSISYLTDNSVNSGIHVFYNGKRISFHSYSQNPEILEGRTLVPLRSIFEAMGASVEWDGTTSTATAKRGKVEIKIQIGANEIYKNGKAISVDVPARLMNDRTMVPARVIAEAFGADVKWNGNGRVVLITE